MPLVSIHNSGHSRPASGSAEQGDSYLDHAGHKASAAFAILTVPRDHGFLQSPELAACLRDAAFHMCPSPCRGEVILASTSLPTWPCPDLELLALEALGRVSKLPLRIGNLTELSYASLLKHRPPICDGAGAPSSADHSLPSDSGISEAWLH